MTTPVYINRPYGMCRHHLQNEYVVVIDKQVGDLVRLQEQRMTAYSTMHEMFKQLARNAYLQGVMDCADHAKELKL